MAIVAAHNVPYAATASIAFPEDFVKKVEKARAIRGPRFFHVLAPCPPGWKYPPEETVRLGRLVVDTGIFPLYEIENGRYRVTRKLGTRKPVSEYLAKQGRFGHLSEYEVAEIQRRVDARWTKLLTLEKATEAIE